MFTLKVGGKPVAITNVEEAQAREIFNVTTSSTV